MLAYINILFSISFISSKMLVNTEKNQVIDSSRRVSDDWISERLSLE